MHDHRHSYVGLRPRDAEDRESTRAVPGKTTLVEQMRLAMPAQTSSPSETAGATSPGPTRSAAPTGAEPKGELKKAIDHPERKGAPRRRYAKKGALNRGNVKSNRAQNGVTKQRPGVTLPQSLHSAASNRKVDEFSLNKNASRYFIQVARAEPIDEMLPGKPPALPGEPIEHLKEGDKVYVNPVGSRELLLDGNTHPVWCVLTWRDGRGAAWMKIDDLMRGKEIKKAADSKGGRFAPLKEDVRELAPSVTNAVRFAFCTPKETQDARKKTRKKELYVMNPQRDKHSNRAEHYLPRNVDHNEGDIDQINICLNLPSRGVPPVAADVARSGEYFFVTHNSACVAKVSLFKRDKDETKGTWTQHWVFGFVGMLVEGQVRPNPQRYGWVPAVALKQG